MIIVHRCDWFYMLNIAFRACFSSINCHTENRPIYLNPMVSASTTLGVLSTFYLTKAIVGKPLLRGAAQLLLSFNVIETTKRR